MKKNRRKFLKFLLLGGGTLLLGKLLNSKSIFDFSRKEKTQGFSLGKDFKAVRKNNKMVFFNKKGEKIFTIDQEGTLEIG